MDTLTVFLAPDGPAGGVRDVLRDLSTAGLVEPFLWIREAAVIDTLDGGGRIRAVEVSGGLLTETTLMAAVTGGQHRLVRLCSIIALTGGRAYAESPAEPELATRLRAAAGRAHLVQVRCLLAAPGDTAPSRVLGRDGWHNVLVSPEDARGPDQAHELLPRTTGPVELARHAGPVVAGLLGLWTGMTASCLDERAVPPQQQVRLVRGFYRNVDAAELESRLRERTFSTATTPLPLEHGAAAVHVPDPAAACDTMVEALVQAHPELLPRPAAEVPRAPVERIGWRESLRWFFGFVWAALRDTPEEWFLAKKRQVAGKVATAVQTNVFGGSQAAYRVIVNRMGPGGRPAEWYDLQQASAEVVARLPRRPQSAPPDLSPVWHDFAAGALTLLDGGARDSRMPAIRVGSRLGVLRTAEQSVPDGAGDFTVPAGTVRTRTATETVQASDVIGARTFRAALAPLAADPGVRDGRPTLAAFDTWQHRHAGSYAGRVGQVLAHGVGLAQDGAGHSVEQLEQLERLAADGHDETELVRQRRYGRITRVVTGVAAVALLGVAVLWLLGRADGTSAAALGGAVLLVWVVAGGINFLNGQRALFQALRSQNVLPSQQQVIEENLRTALEDLQRLTEAYGQFLVWTRVVGAVVQDPLRTQAPAGADRTTIRRGLPLSMALGRARVDGDRLGEVAAELRRGLFVPGWLSTSWDTAVSRAAARLGPRGNDLGDVEGAIFAEPAGPGSLLHEWADVIVRVRPFAASSGDRAWRSCMARVESGDGDGLAERLLLQVDPDDATAGRPVPRAQFMAGVDEPRRDPTGAKRFDSAALSVAADGSTATAVEASVASTAPRGLSRTAVLVELGRPAPAWSFAACATDIPGRPTPEEQPEILF